MTTLQRQEPSPNPSRPVRAGKSRLHVGRWRRVREFGIESALFLAAFSAVLITTGIVLLLLIESSRFFYRRMEYIILPPPAVQADAVKAEELAGRIETALTEGSGAIHAQIEVIVRTLDAGPDGTARREIAVHVPKEAREGTERVLAAEAEAQSLIMDHDRTRVRPNISEFLFTTRWAPEFRDPRYGVLPLVSGTITITLVALLVALPVGTTAAIYLSEYANHRVREAMKPILELLSAVPTVVYGYFALTFVTPLLQNLIPGLPGFNMLGAGLVMGVMIIPYVSSLSEDAMQAVPMSLREGSFAMGATRMQTSLRVVVPASFSGITAAYILGISRAIGETMVVAIAAGLQREFTFDPTRESATITSYIVQVAGGDLPHGSTEYQAIFAAGLMLFLMTLAFNILGAYLRKKYRQAY